MGYILNRKIAEALIKEERDTSRRYHTLGIQYNIPELVAASHDEARHANLFENLINSGRI